MTLISHFAKADAVLVGLSLAMIAAGVFFVLTPAQHLLGSDHRTGRWLYEREMKSTGDKAKATAAAAFFYRAFGCMFVLFGLALLAFAFIPSKSD